MHPHARSERRPSPPILARVLPRARRTSVRPLTSAARESAHEQTHTVASSMRGSRAPSSADLKTPSFLPMQRRVADKVIKLRWAASCAAGGTSLSAGTPGAVGVGAEGGAMPSVPGRHLRGRRGTGGACDRRTEAAGRRHRRSIRSS